MQSSKFKLSQEQNAGFVLSKFREPELVFSKEKVPQSYRQAQ